MTKAFSLLFFVLSLSSCAVGPDYKSPHLNVPSTWQNRSPFRSADKVIHLEWWQNFGDPVLEELLQQASNKNYDLKIAATRLKQARAENAKAFADFFPNLDLQGNIGRQRNSMAFPVDIPLRPYDSYQVGFDASWEIDIFGRQRRIYAQKKALAEAAHESFKSVYVSLLGEVARSYISVRHFQNQLDLTKATVEGQERILNLVKKQQDQGQSNKFDVSRAEAQWASTKAQLPFYENQLAQAYYQLELLLGEKPGALISRLEPYRPVPVPKKHLLIKAPIAIIAQRPDIRVAERHLAAATEAQGVARANLYPRISLLSFLGFTSTDSSDLFTSQQNSWSLGGNVLLPFFRFGKDRASVKQSDAAREEALYVFEKAVLAALTEIESALNGYFKEEERRQHLATAALACREAANLAQRRYQAGLSSFLEVLDAERSLYAAESQLAQSEATVATLFVAVYKALGGSWKTLPSELKQEEKSS